jgi:hypothetical protein
MIKEGANVTGSLINYIEADRGTIPFIFIPIYPHMLICGSLSSHP